MVEFHKDILKTEMFKSSVRQQSYAVLYPILMKISWQGLDNWDLLRDGMLLSKGCASYPRIDRVVRKTVQRNKKNIDGQHSFVK